MKVTELMTTTVITIDEQSTIEEAAKIMITNGAVSYTHLRAHET